MLSDIELAQLFVDYRGIHNRLVELEEQIQKEILERKDSQKIAGVKATYYNESADVDYEAAAIKANASIDIVEQYSTHKTTVKWAEVCKELHLNDLDLAPYSTKKPARVVVKVDDKGK